MGSMAHHIYIYIAAPWILWEMDLMYQSSIIIENSRNPEIIQDVFKKVEIFMHGVDSLSEGLTALAESTTTGLSAVDDQLIKAARGGCGYGYRIPMDTYGLRM